MKKPIVRYAVWLPGNREGEFEFLCATQTHLTRSLEVAQKEIESQLRETMNNCDPQMSREEAIEELGGKPVIYKLTMEKVQ